jgi:hypothetical protein
LCKTPNRWCFDRFDALSATPHPQTDPIGSDDDINLYAYVGGDPINGTDPTGLCFDNCPVNITHNAKNASGTVGITGTISYENGLLGNTSAGQVSGSIVFSEDGKGNATADLQITFGMTDNNSKTDGAAGLSAGVNAGVVASNATNTKQLLGEAKTDSVTVANASVSKSQSGPIVAVSATVGAKGGITGASTSSYKTNTVSVPEIVSKGIQSVGNLFNRLFNNNDERRKG